MSLAYSFHIKIFYRINPTQKKLLPLSDFTCLNKILSKSIIEVTIFTDSKDDKVISFYIPFILTACSFQLQSFLVKMCFGITLRHMNSLIGRLSQVDFSHSQFCLVCSRMSFPDSLITLCSKEVLTQSQRAL